MNITIGGIELELPETPISQTLQVNDYFDVKDRRVNYTNEFTVPATPHNDWLFGFSGLWGSDSVIPYRLLPCELIDDGIEITNQGSLRIKGRDSKGYKCAIQDGSATLYDTIEGKRLSDLDFSTLNHTLNTTTHFNSLDNTWEDGYIYGIADWGKTFTDIEYDYQIPCLFKRWVFDKIMEEAGATYEGPFDYISEQVISPNVSFNNDVDILAPVLLVESDSTMSRIYSGWDSDLTFQNQYELFPIITDTFPGLVDGDNIVLNESGYYNINLNGLIHLQEGDWVRVSIKVNNNTIASYYSDVEGFLNCTGDNYFYGNQGSTVAIFIEANTTTYSLINDNIRYRAIWTASFNTMLYSDNNAIAVNFNAIFDMSQTDFVKDIMQQLGLIFQQRRDGVYEFKRIEDIITGDAVDWSDKFNSNESVTFSMGSFTQKNRLGYKYLDDEEDRWADTILTVDDEKLSREESTLFESPYVLALKSDLTLNSVLLSRAVYWDEDNEPIETGPYTFQVVRVEGDINVVNSGGGAVATYSGTFPYLDSFPLRMGNILIAHYPQYNQLVNRPEVLMCEFDLTPFDIYDINFLTKYYSDEIGYFLLNNVKYGGGLAECEVIRLR